jgi:hypothetical protein
MWIEGVAGMGKSALLRAFYQIAKTNVPVCFSLFFCLSEALATHKGRS